MRSYVHKTLKLECVKLHDQLTTLYLRLIFTWIHAHAYLHTSPKPGMFLHSFCLWLKVCFIWLGEPFGNQKPHKYIITQMAKHLRLHWIHLRNSVCTSEAESKGVPSKCPHLCIFLSYTYRILELRESTHSQMGHALWSHALAWAHLHIPKACNDVHFDLERLPCFLSLLSPLTQLDKKRVEWFSSWLAFSIDPF